MLDLAHQLVKIPHFRDFFHAIFPQFIISPIREEVASTSPLQLNISHSSTLPRIKCALADARPASATVAAIVLIKAFDGLCYRASRMNFLLSLGKEKTVGGTFGGQSTPCSPSHLLLCLLLSDEEEAVRNGN